MQVRSGYVMYSMCDGVAFIWCGCGNRDVTAGLLPDNATRGDDQHRHHACDGVVVIETPAQSVGPTIATRAHPSQVTAIAVLHGLVGASDEEDTAVQKAAADLTALSRQFCDLLVFRQVFQYSLGIECAVVSLG